MPGVLTSATRRVLAWSPLVHGHPLLSAVGGKEEYVNFTKRNSVSNFFSSPGNEADGAKVGATTTRGPASGRTGRVDAGRRPHARRRTRIAAAALAG